MGRTAELAKRALERLGVEADPSGGLVSRSPIDGGEIGRVRAGGAGEAAAAAARASDAFAVWREVPAPRRGELVRLFGEALREAKADLGLLVTLEAGKIRSEGLGEVQEMIDICDFAVGLSRQLYGLTIAVRAARAPDDGDTGTRWGPVGVISAFNFPVAVWAWNAALALVCGDPVIWKPSEKTPLTAEATLAVVRRARPPASARRPPAWSQVVQGGREAGEALVDDARLPLISATGSTRMGRAVGAAGGAAVRPLPARARRQQRHDRGALGRPGPGGAGHRLRRGRHGRPALHQPAPPDRPRRDRRRAGRPARPRLRQPAGRRPAGGGNPGRPADRRGGGRGLRRRRSRRRKAEGGALAAGGGRVETGLGGAYVAPAIVRMPGQTEVVRRETFAPILYVMTYRDLDEAIALQNDVPQGLSSCIFTNDLRESERFLSAARLGLRHRQRQHRPLGRGDRRRLRRREGDGRRPRERLGRLEGLHAPPDPDGERLARPAPGPGRAVRPLTIPPGGRIRYPAMPGCRKDTTPAQGAAVDPPKGDATTEGR